MSRLRVEGEGIRGYAKMPHEFTAQEYARKNFCGIDCARRHIRVLRQAGVLEKVERKYRYRKVAYNGLRFLRQATQEPETNP